MNDPYDNGTPKYSTPQDIYDALCDLASGEEIGIIGEMFPDVSWDGQDYYYTDLGCKLKEKFEQKTSWLQDMWLLDLAIWQIGDSDAAGGIGVHDIVYGCLTNSDMGKRLGFKKIFVDEALLGDGKQYTDVSEAYLDEISEFNRFDYYPMRQTLNKVLQEHGRHMIVSPYYKICNKLYSKLIGLKLQDECRLILECRAALTGYDDFMFGLRANQELFKQQEQLFNSRMAALSERYEQLVKNLLTVASSQGVILNLPQEQLLLAE